MAKKDNFNVSFSRMNRPPAVKRFCEGASRTQQQFKDDCDIGKLIKRITNAEDLHPDASARYADVSDFPNYRECLDMVIKAERSFMSLDANIRKKFNNDPQQFLDFMSDSGNIHEMHRLGLAKLRDQVTEAVSKVDVQESSEKSSPQPA